MRRIHLSAVSCVIVIASAGVARGQAVEDVRGRVNVATYVDDLNTTIWSPHALVGAILPWDIGLDLTWGADVITSASVDVITAATTRMTETRNEVGLALRREDILRNTDLTVGYEYSFENDGDSHIANVGLVRGFDQDNWQVALRYNVSLNQIGVVRAARSTWLPMTAHGADATLTRLINQRLLVAVNYSFYYIDGYQASPYRRIPVLAGGDLRGATWVEERVPDARVRHALTLRSRGALGSRTVGAAEYRFYLDDWGVVAHTARLDEVIDVRGGLAVRLSQRVSLQGGADFYEPIYSEAMTYRSRDRRLSAHLNSSVGASFLWELGTLGSLGTVEAYVSLKALAWRYDNFTAPMLSITGDAQLETLGWVTGAVTNVGLEVRP